jgi:hypothetical protein
MLYSLVRVQHYKCPFVSMKWCIVTMVRISMPYVQNQTRVQNQTMGKSWPDSPFVLLIAGFNVSFVSLLEQLDRTKS